AIFYAILTCFFVSIMIAIVRHLSQNFGIFFIVMMRNFFAFILFIPLMFKTRSALFKTQNIHLHIMRNINGLIGMLLWFYAITLIPLPEAVSITFTVPIITTIAAIFFLKEKVSANVWIALFTGFVGVLIIIRPGFRQFHFAYALTILATFSWAISNILVKKMTATDKPQTIVAYMSFIMLILSIPFGIAQSEPMYLADVFWLVMLGLFSNLSHIAMSNAYKNTDLNIVQPFDFTRLIFISIIAYFAFDEVIDLYSIIGATIIMIGTIFVAPKRNKVYNAALANDDKL
ncbi:MAG TPA: DMT family transporter, partial [Rickettsiales bacterium]|nr:DMT family transporter [Rickettsiales bacterium]